ncbi:MAG: ABC transporter permease, partial [Ktedonobacteraceae bacterium]
ALNTSDNATITIHGVAQLISRSATRKVSGQIQQELQQNLGSQLAGSQFSVQSPPLPISKQSNQVQLSGWTMQNTRGHVHMVEGNLPRDGGATLDVAITPEAAQGLHLTVGSTLNVVMSFLNADDNEIVESLPLHVVGIFLPNSPGDHYWHGASFASIPQNKQGALYPMLTSSQSYLSVLEAASNTASGEYLQNGTIFEVPTDLYWYYTIDTAHLDINHLDVLVNGLNNVLVSVSNQPVDAPFVNKTSSNGPLDLVNSFNNDVTVVHIPLLSLAYLIAGLMLFFVSLMTDLLVDRQAEAIAVLRSRGASRQQIFSSLATQSIWVGIVALLAGPLLSILVARLLVLLSLSPTDQGALNVILANPISTALSLYLEALATVVVSILAMIFAINRASRLDVLALRRESARSSGGPVWLRMGLD